jgi:hypothetical protein
MMKELLEKLAKGEVTVDEVLAAIDEADKEKVPRSRLNDKNEEIKELKKEIDNRDKQIADLQKAAKGNEELTKQIEDLKKTNDDWQNKYKNYQLETAIKLAAKDAKDASDILAFINRDGLELQDDGTVKGLDEALKSLKESKPYLFVEETPPGLAGRKPHMPEKLNPIDYQGKNPFSKEHFNLTEQARLFKEDPELYKQLKAQA